MTYEMTQKLQFRRLLFFTTAHVHDLSEQGTEAAEPTGSKSLLHISASSGPMFVNYKIYPCSTNKHIKYRGIVTA